MSVGTSHRSRDEVFHLLADFLPLLVWIAGPDKRCTYVNRQWLDFTGRPLEAELGDGWTDGLHPDDVEGCLDTYGRAFNQREPFIIQYRLRRHDGEYRWVFDKASPLIDGNGAFAGYIGACFDVTEFRNAEAERAIVNDRLHLAMESSRSIGWEWELRTNRVTWFGDLSTIFGMSASSYVGQFEDFRRSVHPDDRAVVERAIEQALTRDHPYAAEFRFQWPDGTVRWVAAKGQLYYAASGEADRMLGIAVDITERKIAEATLHGKERELKEAQRLAGVGSWHWHRETDTVLWSDELYRIAGRDRHLPAVSYQDHPQLYTRESWVRLRGAVDAALHSGTPFELVLEMVRPDGTHRWVMGRGEPVRDSSGQITGLHGTVQDITERQRTEEALSTVNGRLIEAQESERARIARDLHDDIGQRVALLAMSLSQVKSLLPAGSEARPQVEDLQKQTLEIIADVQALSHELRPPRLLHLGLAPAMQGFCQELAVKQSVAVDFSSEHLPPNVPSDVSLCLFRVLQEALHNAVRHSHAAQFVVQLRGTGNAIYLMVRDEGDGFDFETASRGQGLGLSSMKERLKLVGGELFVKSQPGSGTTVLARAPLPRN